MDSIKIIWTALPHGVVPSGPLAGCPRISLVASLQLTPTHPGPAVLGEFPEVLDWVGTLAQTRFELMLNAERHGLEPLSAPNAAVWSQLLHAQTPVRGFEFKDMSRVNLRSFSVRNVKDFVRRHYGEMAEREGPTLPRLLPHDDGSPLAAVLSDLGTPSSAEMGKHASGREDTLSTIGFNRFLPRDDGRALRPSEADEAARKLAFTADSQVQGAIVGPDGTHSQGIGFPMRVLPPDWEPGADAGTSRAAFMGRFATAAEYDFYQAHRFYKRRLPTAEELRKRRPDLAGMPEPVEPPQMEFHDILASYADLPALLRSLGLVLDFAVPKAKLPPSQAQGQLNLGTLQAVVTGKDTPVSHVSLRTAWQSDGRRWSLADRSALHRQGMLNLQGVNDRTPAAPWDAQQKMQLPPFDLYQLDPDGSALKTTDFLLSAQRLIYKSMRGAGRSEATYTTGDQQGLAALRTGGIGVSQHGRAGAVAQDAYAAAVKRAAMDGGNAKAVVLFSEDLLRGWRVDVSAHGKAWRSLCEREGRYTLAGTGQPLPDETLGQPVVDEGYAKGPSTTSQSESPDDHYLHESLFRWSGWSLAAPLPARALRDHHDAGLQTESVEDPQDEAEDGNGVRAQFRPRPGSLPRLRFGWSYRLRARLVDLAGNSLALDEAGDDMATDKVQYGRLEPVPMPVLVLRSRLSEGESLERMVIRSDVRQSPEAYLQAQASHYRPQNGSADFEYALPNARHVVPPKAAQMLCEQHGCFDQAVGSQDAQRIRDAYRLAAREAGSLQDAVPGAQVEIVTPARSRAVATATDAMPPLHEARPDADRYAAGQYVIHAEDLVPIPYLPDPACGGLALHGVPGLRAMLDGKPLQALGQGLFGVVLDKGVRAVRVAADPALNVPGEPGADWRWVLLVDFDTDPADDDANWPEDRRSLRIELWPVAAEFEHPSCGEDAARADPPRWDVERRCLRLFLPQGHVARLRYASFLHARYLSHFGLFDWLASNASARIQAAGAAGNHWMLAPAGELTLVHATQHPVCPPQLLPTEAMRGQDETHATLISPKGDRLGNVLLHGPSTGKFELIAEWQEWVDDPSQPAPKRVAMQAALGEIRLAENHANRFALAAVAGPAVADGRPVAAGNRHEFGDTKFRWISYHLRASTRFLEYLPETLHARPDDTVTDGPVLDQSQVRPLPWPGLDGDSDPGAPLLPASGDAGVAAQGLAVPSSSRPLPPTLGHILPTFKWTRSSQGTPPATQSSTRAGNSLRVYLERPWFSSGDGELLAVVVAEGPFRKLGESRQQQVTQWGSDPLWEAGTPKNQARETDFPLRVFSQNIVSGGERGLRAVGHRVHWSETARQWYADIVVNPGSGYCPFVRLALARLQPHALNASLAASTIVQTDFLQLMPRRHAELSRDGDALTVRLGGPIPSSGPTRQRRRDGSLFETPYVGVSMPQGPNLVESGNRVELVLQQRPDGGTDLDWQDVQTLATGTAKARGLMVNVVAAGAAGRSLNLDATRFVQGLGTARLDRTPGAPKAGAVLKPLAMQALLDRSIARLDHADLQIPPGLVDLFSETFWQETVQLPARLLQKRGVQSRLCLREFERFYGDQDGSETRRPADPWALRAVHERMVYGEFFAV